MAHMPVETTKNFRSEFLTVPEKRPSKLVTRKVLFGVCSTN